MFGTSVTRFKSLAQSADLYIACKHITDAMETDRVPHPDDLEMLQKALDALPESDV